MQWSAAAASCRDVRMVIEESLARFVLVFRSSAQLEYVPWRSSACCVQGSHRSPKVLNVLEFDFSIRVPSNVLEFH